MKHYGIWNALNGGWQSPMSGVIFSTTSLAVATAQLMRWQGSSFIEPSELEVREFVEQEPPSAKPVTPST